ncbi:cystatin-B-like [Montipora capricornis]|uniref:cystatin-B-like n=1 Tax=Montipora foliosa TaxID=591990 RepID=UPI0035F14E88
MNPVCGGTSELKQADENVQKICDQVKGEAENKAGTKFSQFVAKSYKTQVVAGTNYFIKVDVGDGNFVHLRVYQTLPHAGSTLELSAIKTGMKEDDALQYF